jgi:predicted helicase
VPQDTTLRAEYEQGWKVTEMMPVNVLGFQTHRDHFAIDFDAASLQQRIGALRDQSISDRDYADRYRVSESPEWQLVKARQMLRSDRAWQTKIIPCLYRPFDWRFGYFSEAIMDRPRPELCRHMTHPNRSLNVTRQTKAEHWRNAVVANAPTPALYTEIKDGSNAFPLYLYPEAPKEHQLPGLEERTAAPGGRRANLSPAFIAAAKTQLGMEWLEDGKGDRQQTFGPEDVFSYLYAIFYAPTYRERYAEFLKMDFPRLPLTSNPGLFRALAALGDELVRLHLLEGHLPLTTTYPVKGNDVVETVQYTPPVPDKEPGRVWINKTQCFAGVQPEVWEFYVGGYQVCQKWLKDRKGRTLTHAEKEHYQKIVTALAETIRLMAAVDEIIEDYGGWPLTGDRR